MAFPCLPAGLQISPSSLDLLLLGSRGLLQGSLGAFPGEPGQRSWAGSQSHGNKRLRPPGQGLSLCMDPRPPGPAPCSPGARRSRMSRGGSWFLYQPPCPLPHTGKFSLFKAQGYPLQRELEVTSLGVRAISEPFPLLRNATCSCSERHFLVADFIWPDLLFLFGLLLLATSSRSVSLPTHLGSDAGC